MNEYIEQLNEIKDLRPEISAFAEAVLTSDIPWDTADKLVCGFSSREMAWFLCDIVDMAKLSAPPLERNEATNVWFAYRAGIRRKGTDAKKAVFARWDEARADRIEAFNTCFLRELERTIPHMEKFLKQVESDTLPS